MKAVVPREVAARHRLLDRLEALRTVHFPPDDTSLESLEAKWTPAHRTLAFEEIFLLQLALAFRRQGLREEKRGITYRIPDALRTRLGRMLPEGLAYLDSWLEAEGDRCFQLMETSDVALLRIWSERWADLVSFEFIELGEKP